MTLLKQFFWVILSFCGIMFISGCTLWCDNNCLGQKTATSIELPRYLFYSSHASQMEIDAANQLAGYLKKSTGRPITSLPFSPALGKNNCILLGKVAVEQGIIRERELAGMHREGSLVRCLPDENIIGLAARTDAGLMQGVYRLLEDLGFCFFSQDCEYIPLHKTLKFNFVCKKYEPFFDLRFIGAAKNGGNTALLGDPRPLILQEEKKYFLNLYKDHTQGFLLPTYKYINKHPEYYARDSKDMITFKNRRSFLGHKTIKTENYANWVWLCMSNPKAREIAAERLLLWMDQQPDRYFFSIMGGDSEWGCKCEKCNANGNLSDNLIDFANYLGRKAKEKNPDTLLLVFAYSDTLIAPEKYMAADNVVVLFCPYMPPYFKSSVHSFISSEYNVLGGKHFKVWNQKNSGKMGAFDYNMSLYTPFLDKMIVQIKEYAERKMRGVWYCGTASLMPELFIYINSRLLWNPVLDDNGLIDEFCKNYYAGSGELMSQLVELLRSQLREANTGLSPNLGDLRSRYYYTRDFSHKIIKLLDTAEKDAETATVRKRIKSVYARVLYNILLTWKGVSPDATIEDQKNFSHRLRKFLILSTQEQGDSVVKMKKFLWETAHLRITLPWQQDKTVKNLIIAPYRTFEKYHIKQENLQQKINGGWNIPLDAFNGMLGPIPYRWLCELKQANIIYGKYTAFHKMTGSVFIEKPRDKLYKLAVEGQDHDKPLEPTVIRVKINDHLLFEDKNRFIKHGWSTVSYTIPVGIIKQGENIISIENMEVTDNTVARWLAISGVNLIANNGAVAPNK